MAIQDYASLVSAVADWLKRADLTPVIPTFIQLAEQRVSRDIKHYRMITDASGTLTGGRFGLPNDFSSMARLSMSVGGYDIALEPVPNQRALNDRLGGVPFGYYIEGDEVCILGGSGSGDVAFKYYAKVTPLNASNPTNWLMQTAPDVYLYACLLEASPYLEDDARIQIWLAGYDKAINSLQAESDNARYSPSARQRPDFRVA